MTIIQEQSQLSAFSSHSIESLFGTVRLIAGEDQTKTGLQNSFLKMINCGTYIRSSHRSEAVKIYDITAQLSFEQFDLPMMRFAIAVMQLCGAPIEKSQHFYYESGKVPLNFISTSWKQIKSMIGQSKLKQCCVVKFEAITTDNLCFNKTTGGKRLRLINQANSNIIEIK